METKYKDKFIQEWIERIENITYFYYDTTLGHPEFNTHYLFFIISDDRNSTLSIDIPLNNVDNPHVIFSHNNFMFDFEADVSICDYIEKLLEKFPNLIKSCSALK